MRICLARAVPRVVQNGIGEAHVFLLTAAMGEAYWIGLLSKAMELGKGLLVNYPYLLFWGPQFDLNIET